MSMGDKWKQESSWERTMGPLRLRVRGRGIFLKLPSDVEERLAVPRFYWSATGDNVRLSGTAPSKEEAAQECETAALDMLPDGFKET